MRPTLKTLADLKGKQAISYLMKHKQELMEQKKRGLKIADPCTYSPSLAFYKDGATVKEEDTDSETVQEGIVNVTTVANTCWWRDSHGDVGIPGCYSKSIKEQKNRIPHIADHKHSIYAHIGDVQKIYTKNISLKELGINKDGTTECLLFNTDILEELSPQAYKLYKSKRVKQHSIALVYIKLALAVNDKDYEAEYELWKKYIGDIINQKETKDYGYFWAMQEIKVMENSAVLFGSNELTPTLDTKSDTEEEPSDDTPSQPSTDNKKSVDFAALLSNI